jgi:rod shape-determining protein MreB and related proteins
MVFGIMAGVLGSDLAIDIGTTNTCIYAKRQGIVAHEPSVVALQERRDGTQVMLSVGEAAKEMIDKTPTHICTVRPVQDGVVADCELFQLLLTYFLRKAMRHKRFRHLRVVIGVPSNSSSIEQRAVVEPAEAAGAHEVYLIKDPIAAALGAGLDIRLPYGRLVVDIGGGTTDIAIISLAGLVYSKTLRLGGNAIDAAIVQYVRRKHGLVIGMQTAERLKIALGSVLACDDARRQSQIKGTDALSGIPRAIVVSAADLHEALMDSVHTILDAIRGVLGMAPPELLADIVESGLILTGGGALLSGLEAYMQAQLGLSVRTATNPMACVALGSSHALAAADLRSSVTIRF